MSTFILFWNPDLSINIDTYNKLLYRFGCSIHVPMDWSVWEHEKAQCGDRFFLLRCGQKDNGIVMSGYFTSDPVKGNDWSGRGRDVYYMDLGIEYWGGLESGYLPVEVLDQNLPGFNWHGGHSGRLLDEDNAGRLELLWANFIAKMNQKRSDLLEWMDTSPYFDEIDDDEIDDDEIDDDEIADSDDDLDNYDGEEEYEAYKNAMNHCGAIGESEYCDRHEILYRYLNKKIVDECEICGFSYKKAFGIDVKTENELDLTNYLYLGDLDCNDCELIERNYHCICHNCKKLVDNKENYIKYKALFKGQRF